MNSTVRIKEERDQEVAIVKEELLPDGDSPISSEQAISQSIAVKPETCDCLGDCDVCLEALQMASDETRVAEPVVNVSVASTSIYQEQNQNGPTIGAGPYPASSIHSSNRVSAAKAVNYGEAPENSVEQQGTLTGSRTGKRSIGQSGKLPAPKRTRNVPVPTVAAQLEHQVNRDESEAEKIPLRVIIRYLKCRAPGCKERFKNKGPLSSKVQLDAHLLAKHTIEKYACKVKDCTESYATSAELGVHRDSAHGHLGTNWPCGHCETTYSSYKKLREHVNLCHEFGLFACSADKCNYTETTRRKCQTHQHKHRPGRYHCTFAGCSSSFYTQSHLIIHLRSHTKEKPFACSQCPKAFSTKGYLTVHERIHSGIKPFLCSQCPKAFTQKIDLTRHELIHSGLKPYSCTWPNCNYTAKHRSNVIAHVHTVHFGLPPTKKEQTEMNISDDRDARVFVTKTSTTGH